MQVTVLKNTPGLFEYSLITNREFSNSITTVPSKLNSYKKPSKFPIITSTHSTQFDFSFKLSELT